MLIRKFYSAYPPKGRIFIAALVFAFYGINADAKPDMRPLGRISPTAAPRIITSTLLISIPLTANGIIRSGPRYRTRRRQQRVSDSLRSGWQRGDGPGLRLAACAAYAKTPPVIVAVGYQTALPFDQNARAYDYRPAVKEDPADSGWDARKSGGSEAFRLLLQNTIVENVERG